MAYIFPPNIDFSQESALCELSDQLIFLISEKKYSTLLKEREYYTIFQNRPKKIAISNGKTKL